MYAIYKRYAFKYGDTGGLKVKKWEKIYHAIIKNRKVWMIIFILSNIDVKVRSASYHLEVKFHGGKWTFF